MSDSTTARTTTLRLSVPEMDCASCAGTVESALADHGGITALSLSPTTGRVEVTFDPDRTSEADIRAAVEAAGYPVEGVVRDGEGDAGALIPDTREIWTSRRALHTWAGAAFVALGLLFEFVLSAANATLAAAVGYEVTAAGALYLAAVAVAGVPVLRNGLTSLRHADLGVDLLMSAAIVAAVALGDGYLVDAATLAVLFSVAELLEDHAMDRARDSLRELLELEPDTATVTRDGVEEERPVDEVEVGETVVVRTGEKIPLDGVVADGESAVDESPITGESVPVTKERGDEVYAGTIVDGGYLEVEVTSDASDTTLSRIIELVADADAEQTTHERFVDRFAAYYTPAIVVLAALTALVPPLVFGEPVQKWAIRGVAFLVIGCPCAFVISTPVSVVSAVTSAARNGVLVKGGRYLEAMGDVDAVAIDKTGTLTTGDLTVTDVVTGSGVARSTLVGYANAVERRSDHPIADAIVAGTEPDDEWSLTRHTVENFETLTGEGVSATVDGTPVIVGSPDLFTLPDEFADTVADLQAAGKTVVAVSAGNTVVGVIAVADTIRPNAERAVGRLRAQGVDRVVMLTGDNEGTARAVAERAGIDDYRANLLPAEKVDAVEDLRETHTVAMVGDGINDAPALAAADVGVAMGAAGTDTAIETADVALMGDDLERLPYLVRLSKQSTTVIRENIYASLGVKALLALGVPFGVVGVATAIVVGDMGMSLGVTANAMRLARITTDD
ncbi:heavy metal translocating P-type ATPase [Halocalculus aciditolerans]|uniref:Cadmium-transporting ATPase n=1 Tax=Halocalculus aciditolerans TaxID=1383812 RepID=A0A830F805_9EURY|nr:cation-translocating P-type ATPase [Halocalculus aciditolerans]GGL48352.1 cadmium-transporting ATPase [Halocalculus aciditolerans]